MQTEWPQCMPDKVWLPASLNPVCQEPERDLFHKDPTCRLLTKRWSSLPIHKRYLSLRVWPCPLCFPEAEYDEILRMQRAKDIKYWPDPERRR